MRLPAFLFLLMCGAAFALADSGSDFPQTQGRRNQGSGGGDSDFGNHYQPPSADESGEAPAQGANNEPGSRGQDERSSGASGRNGSREDDRAKGKNAPRREEGVGDGSRDGGDQREQNAGPSPRMDLEGAKANFGAVVEAYVAQRSGKGYWRYEEKKRRKTWRLARPSVDEDSVEKVKGERFAALVTLHDVRGDKPLLLEFDVDFSGVKWKVVAVKPPAVSSRR